MALGSSLLGILGELLHAATELTTYNIEIFPTKIESCVLSQRNNFLEMVHCSRRSVVSSSNLNSRLYPNAATYTYLALDSSAVYICLQMVGKLFQSSGTS